MKVPNEKIAHVVLRAGRVWGSAKGGNMGTVAIRTEKKQPREWRHRGIAETTR